jgi:hypothetical protein
MPPSPYKGKGDKGGWGYQIKNIKGLRLINGSIQEAISRDKIY